MSVGRPRQFEAEGALDRALHLFWQVGYEQAGLTKILEVTGLARQSLYNTFKDKKHLYLACLAKYSSTRLEALRDAAASGGYSYDALIDLVFSASDTSTPEARYGCMVVNAAVEFADKDPLVLEIVKSYLGGVESVVRQCLHNAVAAKELPSTMDIEVVCRGVSNGLVGLSVQRRAGRSSSDLRQAASGIVEGIQANTAV